VLDILEKLLGDIQPKAPSSRLLKFAGVPSSQQSVVIQAGNRLEKFWNQTTDTLDDSATDRQVDFFFEKDGVKYYYELKCNTALDSEKLRASNQKIETVTKELGADVSGYFNPTSTEDYYESKIKHNVVGVKSMIKLLDTPFTAEDYVKVVSTKIKEKLNISC
jgi:L-lysine 2,3-aminomutase